MLNDLNVRKYKFNEETLIIENIAWDKKLTFRP